MPKFAALAFSNSGSARCPPVSEKDLPRKASGTAQPDFRNALKSQARTLVRSPTSPHRHCKPTGPVRTGWPDDKLRKAIPIARDLAMTMPIQFGWNSVLQCFSRPAIPIVHDSYMAFRDMIAAWSRISLQAVLEAREG